MGFIKKFKLFLRVTFSPDLTFPSLRFGSPPGSCAHCSPAPSGLGSTWDATGPRVLSRPRQKDLPQGHPTLLAQDKTLPGGFKPRGTAITNSASAPQLLRRLSPLQLPPQAPALCERHVLRAGPSHLHKKPETPKGIKKKSRGVKKEKKNPQLTPWN